MAEIPTLQKSSALIHQTHSADNLHTFASRRGWGWGGGGGEEGEGEVGGNIWHRSTWTRKAGARSVTCVHWQITQTKHLCVSAPYFQTSMRVTYGGMVPQVRMLQARRAWRSGPGGLEVLWAARNHFLPGAWWWRWGGGCSQQRGIPRMLSFNLESA